MTTNNFFVVEAVYSYANQQVINRYMYTAGEGVPMTDALTFAGNFDSTVQTPLSAIIVADVVGVELRIKDLDPDGVNFVFPITGFLGSVADEGLPPFVAWSFLLGRTNGTTFNGRKRYAGVPETWQNKGTIAGSHGAALTALQTGLAAAVSDGTHNFDPVIVSQFLNGVRRTSPLGNRVAFVSFKGISSQNSRKIGRGS